MVRKFMVGSFVLILAYLGLAHATEGGTLLLDASKGASDYAKTLQGR